jgi:hypothetical protein
MFDPWIDWSLSGGLNGGIDFFGYGGLISQYAIHDWLQLRSSKTTRPGFCQGYLHNTHEHIVADKYLV